jgi:hypothetical protein
MEKALSAVAQLRAEIIDFNDLSCVSFLTLATDSVKSLCIIDHSFPLLFISASPLIDSSSLFSFVY